MSPASGSHPKHVSALGCLHTGHWNVPTHDSHTFAEHASKHTPFSKKRRSSLRHPQHPDSRVLRKNLVQKAESLSSPIGSRKPSKTHKHVHVGKRHVARPTRSYFLDFFSYVKRDIIQLPASLEYMYNMGVMTSLLQDLVQFSGVCRRCW